jgi:tRNA(fMet)-specific endonuclease VapC
MLDTNICIYLRQNRPPDVTMRFRQMQHGDAFISAITYGELHYGAERSQQRTHALESLGRLVSLLPVVPLPGEAATAYGEIRTALEARGEMIGGNELWIAAHAKSAGLTLVTNDEREFKRVPDLSSKTGPAAILDFHAWTSWRRFSVGSVLMDFPIFTWATRRS